MIDFPSGSTPPAPTSGTSLNVGDVKAAVLSKLEAIVEVVTARVSSGQPSQPAWDILLKLNPNASTGSTLPQDEISADVMKSLQNGQSVLIQTRSPQYFPVGSRLQVSVSPQQGINIQQLQLPVATTSPTINLLKQWIPQQQPVAPLLANILHLLKQNQQSQMQQLPLQIQIAIRQIVAAMTDPSSIRNPGSFRQALENSGISMENKLASALEQKNTANAPKSPAKPIVANAELAPESQRTARHEKPIQQIKEWLQRALPNSETKSIATERASAPTETTAVLKQVLGADLKNALLQLEKAIQTLPKEVASSADNAAEPEANSPTRKNDATSVAQDSELTDETTPDGKTKAPVPGKTIESTPARDSSPSLAKPSKSTSAVQRYQSNSSSNYSNAQKSEVTDVPDLIPPLPGQIVVQAQSRARPTLKSNDMADAIVKTLLAQVRGATARITAHQLSSHSSRQDNATPTSLSFEIPFLHQGQAEVFQFRIEEEHEPSNAPKGKAAGKRWVVQLGFDIQGLGPMFCQLNLCGNSLSVQFWAKWESTLSNTKAHFDFLEQALNGMGIRVEKIQAQLGMPEVNRTGIRNQLVDVKT